jgi:tripartite ATP-independent transporter DctM subunit
MGMFLSTGGLGTDLFRAFNTWFGSLRGGLAVATIVTCTAFCCVSGSVVATTATVAKVAVPEMIRQKYNDGFAAACAAAGSTLGILIPPSGTLVIYGILTEESIGQLLIAGILPGILTAILLAIAAWLQVKYKPSIAPDSLVTTSFSEKMRSIKYIWPVPVIFFVSMGGIYVGVFTPSEGGAVGAFMALLFSVLTRRMGWKEMISSVTEASSVIIMIMFLIIGGKIFGQFLSITKIPLQLTDAMMALSLHPLVLMLMIFLVFFTFGLFMEGFAVLIIFTPLFYPLVIQMGYNGVWYGIVTILMLLTGFITPPVGVGCIVASSVSGVRLESIFGSMIPFLAAIILSTVIIVLFPQIATFLPSLMK